MDKISIGENIKFLREKSGLTQAALAKYLEVDQSLISKIEKNERAVTSDMLDKLSALFGIPAEDFAEKLDSKNGLTFAFRASEITEKDLESISAINRIALNIKFMRGFLKGENDE